MDVNRKFRESLEKKQVNMLSEQVRSLACPQKSHPQPVNRAVHAAQPDRDPISHRPAANAKDQASSSKTDADTIKDQQKLRIYQIAHPEQSSNQSNKKIKVIQDQIQQRMLEKTLAVESEPAVGSCSFHH